jgi:hypothetical protein
MRAGGTHVSCLLLTAQSLHADGCDAIACSSTSLLWHRSCKPVPKRPGRGEGKSPLACVITAMLWMVAFIVMACMMNPRELVQTCAGLQR